MYTTIMVKFKLQGHPVLGHFNNDLDIFLEQFGNNENMMDYETTSNSFNTSFVSGFSIARQVMLQPPLLQHDLSGNEKNPKILTLE